MPLPYIGPAPASATDVATKAYADSVGGGGGGLTVVQTIIDIGNPESTVGTATVTAVGVTSTSKIFVFWGNVTDSSENDPEMDEVTFIAKPGTGSFVVKVVGERQIAGKFPIQYFVVA
jgi:hypothetical protein